MPDTVLIADCRGLGPKSAAMLSAVGIDSKAELEKVGPIAAYVRVRDETDFNPGRNLLYAMIGAIDDKDWRSIAKEQRASLIFALEGYDQLEALFAEDGYELES